MAKPKPSPSPSETSAVSKPVAWVMFSMSASKRGSVAERSSGARKPASLECEKVRHRGEGAKEETEVASEDEAECPQGDENAMGDEAEAEAYEGSRHDRIAGRIEASSSDESFISNGPASSSKLASLDDAGVSGKSAGDHSRSRRSTAAPRLGVGDRDWNRNHCPSSCSAASWIWRDSSSYSLTFLSSSSKAALVKKAMLRIPGERRMGDERRPSDSRRRVDAVVGDEVLKMAAAGRSGAGGGEGRRYEVDAEGELGRVGSADAVRQNKLEWRGLKGIVAGEADRLRERVGRGPWQEGGTVWEGVANMLIVRV